MAGGASLRPVPARLMLSSSSIAAVAEGNGAFKCKCNCHSKSGLGLGLGLPLSFSASARTRASASVAQAQAEAEADSVVSSSGAFFVLDGVPQPLGPTPCDGGVNFALYSSSASAVALCLFTLHHLQANRITEVIPLNPDRNRTGNVWHVLLSPRVRSAAHSDNAAADRNSDPDFNFRLEDMLYGFQMDGPFSPHQGLYFNPSRVLLDPYAKAVVSRDTYGVLGAAGNCWPQMAGMIPLPTDDFDWQGDCPLGLHQRDLVIYEMHVRGYTKHDSSNVQHPGTFASAAQKLDHLKELGINCIELMPCHEFNELEYFDDSPVMGQHK